MKDSKKEVVKLLETLVSIPSFLGKDNPDSETNVSKFLVDYFKEKHPSFSLTSQPFEDKRVNLLFQNSEEIKILFACHTDTVAPSSSQALSLKIKGDKAFGLGAKDMKGGIVSTLMALKRAKEKGVGVLFYGDEETSFKGIKKVVQNSQKLFKGQPKIIVSPESRFDLGVGARGITSFEIKLYGKRAHSARPHLGVDAIRNLFGIVEKTQERLNKKKSALGKTTLNIAHIHGGLLENGSLGSHIGSVPDYCEAIVSIRNATTKTGPEIVEMLQKEAQKLKSKAKIKILEDYPSRTTPNEVIKRVKKTIEKTGKRIQIGNAKQAGFNDMAILARELKTYAVNFGPYGEGNHTKNEWVSIRSIQDTTEAFVELIREYANDN